MHSVKELVDKTADLIDKYTMPDDVKNHLELLLREIVKRDLPTKKEENHEARG